MARFCTACGTPLADETARSCTKCGAAIAAPEGMMNQLAEALLKRYRDAYGIAHSTVKLGQILKRAAVWIAIVIGLVGFAYNQGFFGILIVLLGLLIAVLVFVSGVIISAQGQIMLAMLDTAVNTSPNAEPTEKAVIMELG